MTGGGKAAGEDTPANATTGEGTPVEGMSVEGMSGEVASGEGMHERFARRMLAERAALLAARRDGGAAQAAPGRRMLVLDMGGRECCIDLDAVLRVTDPAWSDMPRRPDCPASVRGVYGYQGDLYTVFDLAMLLGEEAQPAPGAMILLRSVSSVPLARIALLAGAARGVMDIPATAPSVVPSGFPTAVLPGGRHIVVLDPVRLFSVRYSGV